MSPTLGIFIMMNNYFHDVATALLLASGVAMWVIVNKLGDSNDERVVRYFLDIYKSITRLAKFALGWIIIGGIPRVLAYRDFEWANAAGKGQVPALIVKHILFFAFVGAGAHVWIKISRRIKSLREHAGELNVKRSSK
ncbi:MAG: hypothetical protein WAV13_15575 [Thermodesulfovibrionales bacterium]